MGTRRHVKRRKSKMNGEKRIVCVALIWIAVAVVAIFISLLIGNILKKKAEKIKLENSSAFQYTYDSNSVAPIRAPFVDVKGKTNQDIVSKINALEKNTDFVSICLTDENGIPLYNSSVYSSIVKKVGSFDLESSIAFMREKNIYVSACILCKSFNVEDEKARNALIAVEAAIITEAFEAGINDIIIYGLPVKDLGISYVARLFEETRKLCPDVVLGAAIDYNKIRSENGAAAIKAYSEFADFCAIDLSDAQKSGNSLEASVKSLIYMFEVYPLRILMSASGMADFNNKAEILKSIGINNYQAYKNSESSGSAG